ncbi:MAG: ROK family protein [Candidatus Ornithospirochaeta sp.]
MNKTRNLSEVSLENGRMVRCLAFLSENADRSFISKATGLTFPVVTKNVNELISSGFLEALPKNSTRKGSGRISSKIRVNPFFGWVIGIELGPYAISLSLLDSAGTSIKDQIIALETPNKYEDLFAILEKAIEKEIENSNGTLIGIGISTPGGLSGQRGVFYRFDHPEWNGINIEKELENRFSVPVLLTNNVAAMALYYNLRFIKEPGHYSFFFALRGIASVEMDHEENNLYSTVSRSGQVGHMIMDVDGEVCPTCGNRGCLESVGSEKAILEKIRKVTNNPNLTMDEVLEERKKNPSYMEDIFSKALKYLSVSISNIQNYSPVHRMFIMTRLIRDEIELERMEKEIRKNLLATKDIDVSFTLIPYTWQFGSRSAAFCLLYDRYVGIETQLL